MKAENAIAVQDKPILFSGAMVRKIIEDLKTNTRRVMKPQPSAYVPSPNVHLAKRDSAYFDSYCNAEKTAANPRGMSEFWCWWSPDNRQGPDWIRCPYGKPGTRLWVRETFSLNHSTHYSHDNGRTSGMIYRASWDGDVDFYKRPLEGERRWRPSIHMPRWASRLTLEIVSVKVERVQEISLSDCQAEGITLEGDAQHDGMAMREAFRKLWDSINEKRGFGWAANPWVWAIEFKAVK